MQSCKNTDDGFVFNMVATPMGCDKEGCAVGTSLHEGKSFGVYLVVCGEIIV